MMKETAMRKIMLAGAVALALMMGGCMLFDQPVVAPEFDDEGRKMVTLKLKFSGDGEEAISRNLSEYMAAAAISYYEVVFYTGTGAGNTSTSALNPANYQRVGGPRGKVLTVRLPENTDIAGPTKAVCFAGVWNRASNERVLLAVGLVNGMNTEPDDGTEVTGPAFVINAATRSIRFGLSAVETRFNNALDSDFQISETRFGGGYHTTTASSSAFLEMQIDGKRTPVYRLPANTSGVAFPVGDATLPTVGNTNVHPATFSYRIGQENRAYGLTATTDYQQGVWVLSVPNNRFDSWAVLNEEDVEAGLVIIRVYYYQGGNIPTTATIPGLLPAKIGMNIVTGNKPSENGYCLFFPNLSVKAMADIANDKNEVWALRNGLTFYLPHDNVNATTPSVLTDKEAGGHSMGGGIILSIGESGAAGGRAIRIVIIGPPPTP